MTTSFQPFRSASARRALASLFASIVLAAPAAAAGVALYDGVVVDAARSTAYVMSPQGGIAAYDLEHGVVLWRSTAGERPLLLADDLLVAQARPGEHGELRLVALDVQKGGVASAEADVAMPSGVRAEVVDTWRQAFRVTAVPSRQGIVVAWESAARPNLKERSLDLLAEGPMARTASRDEPVRGSALFDPHAGRLLPLEATDAAALAGPRPAVARSLSAPQAAERRFASADGLYVLASRRTGDATSPTPYRWTISEAATGALLGTVDSAISMAPFAVVGKRLFHVAQPASRRAGSKGLEQPLRLRAVDLTTGRELWSWEIRDPAFRGPFPL